MSDTVKDIAKCVLSDNTRFIEELETVTLGDLTPMDARRGSTKLSPKDDFIEVNLDSFSTPAGKKVDKGSSSVYKMRKKAPVIVANGKVLRDQPLPNKPLKKVEETAKQSKDNKTIKKTLAHLAKMVKGCYSSPMSEDSDYNDFCKEAIANLIDKKTEQLGAVEVKQKPVSYLKNVRVKEPSPPSKISKKSLRSDERLLDWFEIDADKSLAKEDKYELRQMVFGNFDGTHKMDTDHFYRYFVEKMLKFNDKKFAKVVEGMNFENTNIVRLKNKLIERREVNSTRAREVLIEKERKLQEARELTDDAKKNVIKSAKEIRQKEVIAEAREKKYFTTSKPWMAEPDKLWMDDPDAWLLWMKKKASKKKVAKKKTTTKKMKKKVVKRATAAKKKVTKKKVTKKRVSKKRNSKK